MRDSHGVVNVHVCMLTCVKLGDTCILLFIVVNDEACISLYVHSSRIARYLVR